MISSYEPLPARTAVVSGRFYPSSATELNAEISEYLKVSARMHTYISSEGEDIRAIVVPHAGYVFSGNVAASAYNLLRKSPRKTVFLIGSSHHALFEKASIYYSGSYVTPLGEVPVDVEIAGRLLENSDVFGFFPEAHKKEHSLEVQLPFLQYVMSEPFKIVPVIIGSQSKDLPGKIAEGLAPFFADRQNLFIISTDLSHYPLYNEALKIDQATTEALCTNDPELFYEYIKTSERRQYSDLATSMCGWTSALVLLNITRNLENIAYQPVLYQNSGDIPIYGDKSHVVGYQSVAVVRKQKEQHKEYSLSDEEKQELLDLAHEAIREAVRGGDVPGSKVIQPADTLSGKQGAFVSVYVQDELRGCIGRIVSEDPLYDTIRKMAAASATQDSRFRSIGTRELDSVQIEISVLSPLRKITSTEEIIPGKHGILIRKGFNSGTFLPQVATKTGWSAEQLLQECSERKAGLGRDGWRDAEIFTYEALVFSDRED
ncbi:MAG: AmmeMemoRadiSam system protein B [Bacteroidales bacterium]|nr:AmmeMemoRadiSam system protein B [Bacteroidales bacterium]